MRSGIVFLITLVLSMRLAHADSNSKTLIKQLTDSSQKVRLAAALNLAKLESQDAILPLAKAVVADDDASVRAAAAVALQKSVNASTSASVKKLAIANLKTAASQDSSATVKSQAQKALDSITGGSGSGGASTGGSSGSGAGGIYVNIGPMSSKTTSSKNDKLRALMVKTAQKTMAKVASNMNTTWSGGGTPTKANLQQKGVAGFYVDGTLNTLDIKTSGGGATISCKVSMLLADFPDKSVFGFLNGGASVTASSSASDQELASEDCVTAVIENLIANKIVPTIKSKVP
jgi:hypothetical protein